MCSLFQGRATLASSWGGLDRCGFMDVRYPPDTDEIRQHREMRRWAMCGHSQSKKGRQLPALPTPHYVLSLNQMRDLGEYLRAYVAYVSANLGWGKALRFVLVWLARWLRGLWCSCQNG